MFECENKLRIQSALKLKLKTKTFGEIELRDFTFKNNTLDVQEMNNIFMNVSVEPSDITNARAYVSVIIYLAGYWVHSALKREMCLSCKGFHLLDKEIDLNIVTNL